MESYRYRIDEVWELTLPEVAAHLEKLDPCVSEPEWFVKSWRRSSGRQRLEALQKLTGRNR
jgi:hypothetical protein